MHHSTRMPPQHLTRTAVMDSRPSPPPQGVRHHESLRVPDALPERARQLGGPDAAIDRMEDALGLTAARAAHREGFTTLVTQVTLAHVGLLVSSDVTRLSRHGSAWSPLVDLCGSTGGWMAESDGLSAPATVTGRRLLGLKGTRSAWERHTMQARLTAGLLHTAERGAWALTVPTGRVRQSQGTGVTMPNQAAQARLALVCETFGPCRSARNVVDVFTRHTLCLPRRDRVGALVCTAPRGASVLAMLTHPASAGACPSGRTRTLRREASQVRPPSTRLPQEPWRVWIPDVSPPSSSGDTSRQMQTRLTDHHAEYARHTTRGLPRPGQALWHGLVSCGACGHTMVGQEQGGTRSLWHALRQPSRTPVCP